MNEASELMNWKMNYWNSLPDRKRAVLAELYRANDWRHTVLRGDQNIQTTIREMVKGGLLEETADEATSGRPRLLYRILPAGARFFEECFTAEVLQSSHPEDNLFYRQYADLYHMMHHKNPTAIPLRPITVQVRLPPGVTPDMLTIRR